MTESELYEEVKRLKQMIRYLCRIIESEYPESDSRYEFMANCLTDIGENHVSS